MNLSSLFPANVVIVHATDEMWETPVRTEEERLIQDSVAKRQRQYRAGRNAAHAALEQLDAPDGPLLRGENRQPIWPRGYVGSISHCDDSCVAVCAVEGEVVSLGIDVEPLKPLKPKIARYTATEDGQTLIQR
ncbi:MAG: hypothetical protein AB2595_20690, partial [Candidatus Thiodiazotropha endolucinida]